MKFQNIIAVGLVALAGVTFAQQSEKKLYLPAYVQEAKGMKTPTKPNRAIYRAAGKDAYVYVDDNMEEKGLKTTNHKLFFMQTPVDMAEAEKSYVVGDYAAARTKLAAVKSKYKGFVGLDRNPATRAAILELKCAVRQLDFAALKGFVDSFPEPKWLNQSDLAVYMSAEALVKATSGASADEVAALVTKIKESGVGKILSSKQYSWLEYAQAYATAAAIPAAELEGTISEANLAAANKAIDGYCRAGMASHGGEMELPIDAMCRAQALLWAMPGVKDYSGAAAKDAKMWDSAPYNFRDAVALAYMLKNVFGVSNATVDAAAKFFVNKQEGK